MRSGLICTSFGHIAPEGIGYLPRLERVVEDPEADIPDLARDICCLLLEQIAHLTDRINALKARIAAMSDEAEMPRRLQTMPGVGPITALAVETFAPPMEQFRRGRDFAAWLRQVLPDRQQEPLEQRQRRPRPLTPLRSVDPGQQGIDLRPVHRAASASSPPFRPRSTDANAIIS
jgi:transposase